MSFFELMEIFFCLDIYFRLKIFIWCIKNDLIECNDEYVFLNDF